MTVKRMTLFPSSDSNFPIFDKRFSYNPDVNDPFGAIGAAVYVDDIKRVSERYRTAHAIQNDIVCRFLERVASPRKTVLDLGCGTADDGVSILSRDANAFYIGVDSSPFMLAYAQARLAPFGGRFILAVSDITDLTAFDIANFQRANALDSDISCCISSLCLHHYGDERKAAVYDLAYQVLASYGVFVVTDLYSHDSDICKAYCLDVELGEIGLISEHPDIASGINDSSTLTTHHYTRMNRPSAISKELISLSRVGFQDIELLFKHGQLGVIYAEKDIRHGSRHSGTR